jgi:hypothetical protein
LFPFNDHSVLFLQVNDAPWIVPLHTNWSCYRQGAVLLLGSEDVSKGMNYLL